MTRPGGVGTLVSADAVLQVCRGAVLAAAKHADEAAAAVQILRGELPAPPANDRRLPGWMR
jgi:hypothetical protein